MPLRMILTKNRRKSGPKVAFYLYSFSQCYNNERERLSIYLIINCKNSIKYRHIEYGLHNLNFLYLSGLDGPRTFVS